MCLCVSIQSFSQNGNLNNGCCLEKRIVFTFCSFSCSSCMCVFVKFLIFSIIHNTLQALLSYAHTRKMTSVVLLYCNHGSSVCKTKMDATRRETIKTPPTRPACHPERGVASASAVLEYCDAKRRLLLCFHIEVNALFGIFSDLCFAVGRYSSTAHAVKRCFIHRI